VITTRDDFIEIVVVDDDWIKAEFEAIISAEWPDSPAAPVPSHGIKRPSRPSTATLDGPHGAATDEIGSGAAEWMRERSPPSPDRCPTDNLAVTTKGR